MANSRKKGGNTEKNDQGGFLRLGMFRPILSRWFFLSVVVIGIILIAVFQWDAIYSWLENTIRSMLRILGWGFVLVVVIAYTFIWSLWTNRFSFRMFRWHQWIGGVAIVLAIWGALGVIPSTSQVVGAVSNGGKVGIAIAGEVSSWIGIWRVVGLALVGTILIFPGAFVRFFPRSYRWIGSQFSQPGHRMPRSKKSKEPEYNYQPELESSYEPAPGPDGSIRDEIFPEIETKPVAKDMFDAEAAFNKALYGDEKGPTEKAPARARKDPSAPSTPQELKQVAQDVWKKYGESPSAIMRDGWKVPPVDILDVTPEIQFSQADNAERAKRIEEALASYGVDASVIQINAGPTVTQFGVEPGWDRRYKEKRTKDENGNTVVTQEEVSKTRVKVDRISNLANDLALALAAPTIRIEAPVPGKAIVGIEVPNTKSTVVSLRGVIETPTFQKLNAKTRLAIALGKGAGGEAISGDLAKMPHLLIAGATGSGKTVCLNAIICCLILNNTPADVRFIMIDPKRVEMVMFNSIPHLAAPVIVDPVRAVQALRGLSQEMNDRYTVMAKAGARNIEGYNKNREGDDKMPYLVLVIDELADLMMTGDADEVEQTLCRLAQLSRAVGIHLVVATQRPSVDVVTGLIKANFPTRISFAVTSQVDSRTILDFGGAEKLLGSGDMLYMPPDASKPKRLQGCFVSDAEAERLVYFWNSQHREEPAPRLKIEEIISRPPSRSDNKPEDSLMQQARDLAMDHDHISTSFLQRKLRIGYPRAARIMEALTEEMGEDALRGETEEEEDQRGYIS